MPELDYAGPQTPRDPARRRYIIYPGIAAGIILGSLQSAISLQSWVYDIDGPPLALNGPLILMALTLHLPWAWVDKLILFGGPLLWGLYGWMLTALRRPFLVASLLVLLHAACGFVASRLY